MTSPSDELPRVEWVPGQLALPVVVPTSPAPRADSAAAVRQAVTVRPLPRYL